MDDPVPEAGSAPTDGEPEGEQDRPSLGNPPAEGRRGWIVALSSPYALVTIGLATLWSSAALYEPQLGIVGFVIVAAALVRLYQAR